MTSLEFKDPEKVLAGLRWIEENADLESLPAKARHLRTRDTRPLLEARQAALFSYGMSAVLRTPVSFAMHEDADYDAILSFERDAQRLMVPVQLKEVVPEDVNPRTSFQMELDKLKKYVDSRDLIVVFHLNRRCRLNVTDLIPPVNVVAEIWIVAGANEDMSEWVLIGNILDEQCYTYRFSYPAACLPEGIEWGQASTSPTVLVR